MDIIKSLYKKVNLFLTRFILSKDVRNTADKYYSRTLKEFKKKYKRSPNRDEKFLIVVKASHRTSGKRISPGSKGHNKRQWIRKYLLLKNNIRNKYKIQPPKKESSNFQLTYGRNALAFPRGGSSHLVKLSGLSLKIIKTIFTTF